jgi:hypothetical protein
LYTVSVNDLIKMNSLENIGDEINSIDLGASGGIITYEKPLGGVENSTKVNGTSQ